MASSEFSKPGPNPNGPESMFVSGSLARRLNQEEYDIGTQIRIAALRQQGHEELAKKLEEYEDLRVRLGVPESLTSKEYDFSGQTILVTGGASGIGRETVRQFVQSGAHVISFDNNGPMLKEATDTITQQNPRGSVEPFVVDVGKQEQWQPIIDRIPRIDVFCNVAAIIDPPLDQSNPESQPNFQDLMKLWSTPEGQRKVDEDLIQVFNTDFRGPYLLSIAIAARMTEGIVPAAADDQDAKTHRNGSMAHVGSTNVFTHPLNRPVYGPMKAALHYFTEYQAQALAPFGIRVNCVAPGATEGTLVVRDIEAAQKRMPLGINQTRHVARAMLFLASDQAENITGQIVRVDGGRTL